MTHVTIPDSGETSRQSGLAEWKRLLDKAGPFTVGAEEAAVVALSSWLVDVCLRHDEEQLRAAVNDIGDYHFRMAHKGRHILANSLLALAEVARAGLDRAKQHNWPRQVDRDSLDVRILQCLAATPDLTATEITCELEVDFEAARGRLELLRGLGYVMVQRRGLDWAYETTPRGEEAVRYWAESVPR